jgi:hypothetical protein
MRCALVVVMCVGAACAATGPRVCPAGSRLASQDPPTGRVEWCTTALPTAAVPAPGRAYAGVLGLAHPGPMRGDLHGPFTRWYPGGGIESHGDYVVVGPSSVPHGVWGMWHPDGSRKSVGRYDRGRPVGCFALWDEAGNAITGMVDGEELRAEPCTVPPHDHLRRIERRSHPRAGRSEWGDASMIAIAQTGTFGAANATQQEPDPSARGMLQLAVRHRLGRLRVGPALTLRLAESDDLRAFAASGVAAIAAPLPHHRLAAELELQLGVQHVEITARRTDRSGAASVGARTLIGGVRFGLAFQMAPRLHLVGGARVDGSPRHETVHQVRYCAPQCGPAIDETWRMGGAAWGIDLGIRVIVR